MKAKLLSLFLVAVLLCALVACMPTTPTDTTTGSTPTTTTAPVSTTLKPPTSTPAPAVTTTVPLEIPGDQWRPLP